MRVTIHQPDFLPWLGFFDRWRVSDLFIVLDDVQFLRRGWHHRDKIKTATGPTWITVPVQQKGKFEQSIRDVLLDGGSWKRKHLASIRAAYGKAPSFSRLFPLLETVYAKPHTRLIDLNMDILILFAELLGITTPITFASASPVTGRGTARLVQLCMLHGARSYLTGTGSRGYLEESLFTAQDIQVEWQHFELPVHPQLHGSFIPGLSALDSMMMGCAWPVEAAGED